MTNRVRADGVRQPLRVHVAIVVQERHADHMGVVQFCDRDVEVVTGSWTTTSSPGCNSAVMAATARLKRRPQW